MSLHDPFAVIRKQLAGQSTAEAHTELAVLSAITDVITAELSSSPQSPSTHAVATAYFANLMVTIEQSAQSVDTLVGCLRLLKLLVPQLSSNLIKSKYQQLVEMFLQIATSSDEHANLCRALMQVLFELTQHFAPSEIQSECSSSKSSTLSILKVLLVYSADDRPKLRQIARGCSSQLIRKICSTLAPPKAFVDAIRSFIAAECNELNPRFTLYCALFCDCIDSLSPNILPMIVEMLLLRLQDAVAKSSGASTVSAITLCIRRLSDSDATLFPDSGHVAAELSSEVDPVDRPERVGPRVPIEASESVRVSLEQLHFKLLAATSAKLCTLLPHQPSADALKSEKMHSPTPQQQQQNKIVQQQRQACLDYLQAFTSIFERFQRSLNVPTQSLRRLPRSLQVEVYGVLHHSIGHVKRWVADDIVSRDRRASFMASSTTQAIRSWLRSLLDSEYISFVSSSGDIAVLFDAMSQMMQHRFRSNWSVTLPLIRDALLLIASCADLASFTQHLQQLNTVTIAMLQQTEGEFTTALARTLSSGNSEVNASQAASTSEQLLSILSAIIACIGFQAWSSLCPIRFPLPCCWSGSDLQSVSPQFNWSSIDHLSALLPRCNHYILSLLISHHPMRFLGTTDAKQIRLPLSALPRVSIPLSFCVEHWPTMIDQALAMCESNVFVLFWMCHTVTHSLQFLDFAIRQEPSRSTCALRRCVCSASI